MYPLLHCSGEGYQGGLSMKSIKKVGLSFALIGALSMAHAACTSAFCSTGDIAVGALYSNYGGNASANANVISGYVKLGFDYNMLYRLRLGGTLRLGAGNSSISGTSLASYSKDNVSAYLGIGVKLGFNVATLESPVFVNFVADIDSDVAKALTRGVYVYGLELEARPRVTDKTRVLVSVGGGAAGAVYGFSDAGSMKAANPAGNGVGYGIFGSFGFSRDVGEQSAFYVKAIGKYYDLPASQNITINTNTQVGFPAAKSWQAGIETGLTF